MKVTGAVGGLDTGYSSLNVDSPCIHEGMHSVSNCEWIIQLNSSMKVLGAPLDGDAIGSPGGSSLASGS